MKTKIIASAVSMIALSIISGMINLITYKKNPKNYTRSINKFTIRTSSTMCLYGVIYLLVGTGFFFGFWLYDGIFEKELRQIIIIMVMVSIPLMAGLVCLLAPLPRFWDIVVNGNDITIIKFFVFTKSFKISDIEKCVMTVGDIRVYVKGRKHVAFLVDAMTKGVNNFLKRMEKEGILVEDNRPAANAEKENYLTKKQEEKVTDKNYFISLGGAIVTDLYMLLTDQVISVLIIPAVVLIIVFFWLETIRYTPHEAEKVYRANKITGKINMVALIAFAIMVLVKLLY